MQGHRESESEDGSYHCGMFQQDPINRRIQVFRGWNRRVERERIIPAGQWWWDEMEPFLSEKQEKKNSLGGIIQKPGTISPTPPQTGQTTPHTHAAAPRPPPSSPTIAYEKEKKKNELPPSRQQGRPPREADQVVVCRHQDLCRCRWTG